MGHRESSLREAIRDGDAPRVGQLLAEGVDLAWVDAQWKDTALHWATDHARAEIVSLLLGAGARADIQNEQGLTPLMNAALRQDLASVRALLPTSPLDPISCVGITALGHARSFNGATAVSAAITELIASEPERRQALAEAKALREAIGKTQAMGGEKGCEPGSASGPKLRV